MAVLGIAKRPRLFHPLDQPLRGWKGLLHAHFRGCYAKRATVRDSLVRDLATDPVARRLDHCSPLIVIAGAIIPGGIALLVVPTALGFAKGVLWGGAVRMFMLSNIVWSVNSFSHMFGSLAEGSRSSARNHRTLGWLAFGDGWHPIITCTPIPHGMD